MTKKLTRFSKATASAFLFGTLISPIGSLSANAEGETAPGQVKLRILETTDIHANVMPYDYYKDAPTLEFGLAKTATLIKEARKEVDPENSMLFDSGDLLQGNPLADYVAKVKKLQPGEVHPVYKAMNTLNYDAASLGNHEFNYGLDFLDQAKKGANFPYVNANIYKVDGDNDDSNDVNEFEPYKILDKKVKDANGNEQTIKVGVIGFVPPQIMDWDKDNLAGKVKTKDIVKTAEKFIPKMRTDGAQVIIALAHSGCDVQADGLEDAENAVYSLSKVSGIDAILFGHKHVTFPEAAEFAGKPGIDQAKGTINGVPSLEAGYWGNNLGVMDITLENENGQWKVKDSQSVNRPIMETVNGVKVSKADADQTIVDAVKEAHEGTLTYVRGKIGETSAPMDSYFARVQDDPTIQIVNNAQIAYVKNYIDTKLPEYKGLTVLSAGAPFKAGRQGPSDYTNIAAGDLSIKSANDLYLYPNTLKAIELTGAQVKEWLEMSAGQFNQIDPAKKDPQVLINYGFEPFNYDVIDGVKYQIDVTQPAKYDLSGKVVNPDANRIKNLTTLDGKAIDLNQKFIVATNNYRASGGGNFPGLAGGKAKIVVDSPDENRQVLMDYISSTGKINPSADSNWSIQPINKDVTLTFKSSPDAEKAAAQTKTIKYLASLTDDKGTWGSYSITPQSFTPAPSHGDTTPPKAPSVSSVTDHDRYVTGKAEAASSITIRAGKTIIGVGMADKYGKFSVSIKTQKANTLLTVTATDKAGNMGRPAVVTVKDKTAPKSPSVHPLKTSSTLVYGKAEPRSYVYIRSSNKTIGWTTASKTGNYAIKIKKQKAGHAIYVKAKDAAGNISIPNRVVIKK
ncbi:2',3'-cyclic-nucleotide 2'-phosphodiesterase / 3'-nucleotidase/2',3'-cyclic-nucleotide 2'-phosphodiesterase / 3'-nucleotidase / 5'-nucleotidase [Bacillus sp. OV322]|uniref:bifunctional 2',3'-cyclic-nucleotide 2'-phosphodiesterase/3'-nucleotidase n=1 Tax=Bacillus sp. OV322 TaxID=1882764 RepID=UPI0008F35E44|nr:bifunctional 2',3'-cyclic-nucleotide 2'-phosphodiesterase/3'-nucleotidase [Bacillus sp. OV322]SFC23179.1 2',3'-cyclic-nucleotide 2'-phosphodiesterase / 3'-nucleotidase/2',3'-cyclic-nucleotide 2'-phosphodiesterase / 3'-nucleotidase / 5'-nucleotidase [Bacillus sp. OV322]